MKYFTKEWYRTNQCTGMHLLLKPSERASIFSESYFQELYDIHVQERLEQMKRVCDVDIEDLAARFRAPEAAPTRLDGEPLSEQEEQKFGALNVALADALLEIPPMQFDPERERQLAHKHYLFNLHRFERILPSEIQNKIADMRVLALGYATPEVMDEIRAYCVASEHAVNTVIKAYQEEFNHNFSAEKPSFYANFDLHDCQTLSIQQDNKYVHMIFNDCSCCFRDAEIIHYDAAIIGAYWLYDEIYPLENGGYEIHALLFQVPDSEWNEGTLAELIIRCKDVEICFQN